MSDGRRSVADAGNRNSAAFGTDPPLFACPTLRCGALGDSDMPANPPVGVDGRREESSGAVLGSPIIATE